MAIISQVERSAMHKIVSWMKEIIKEQRLPFQVEADIELVSLGRKRNFPDILLFKKYPNEVACLIEFKPPSPYDPYDPDLIDKAYEEANKAPGCLNGTCRYFGTWNLNKFILWDKKKYNAESYLDMIFKPYEVTNARNINDITRSTIEESVKKFLKNFLIEFNEIYFRKKPAPKLYIDELFIYRLRTAIDSFFIPISEEIYKKTQADPQFKLKLRKWFTSQGWLFNENLDDFDRVARQYAYLIVDKVIFYNTLRLYYKKLDEIKIDKECSPQEFKHQLQSFFNKALEIDFEPIFAENFLETLPLPKEIIPQLISFIESLDKKYNFSNIGYEVIGRVFERLIPEKERHLLGQYFTRSDVVDIINTFCIKNPTDKILDPSCGAATFLIRAYSLLQELDKKKTHSQILQQLFGIDISKFAAHLSTINLASKDLSEIGNYPNITNIDFFDTFPKQPIKKKYKLNKDGKPTQVIIPFVDVIVGNPPYTRQEDLEKAFDENYKTKLNKIIKVGSQYPVGKRSGIYSYFIMHSSVFLKKGGRFGFIISNSWLDTDYGKYLQKFLLDKFKIIAILESKVEKWFEDADINTCIIILEKCNNDEERNNNLIKFVQIKTPLKEIIPPTQSDKARFDLLKKIINKVLQTNEFHEDKQLKIWPKKQIELFFEGYDDEKKEYVGSKWGKYLRAPDIYFKILEKGKNIFIPLKQISKIRRGYTSGANEFFYLKKTEIEKFGIEKEFWAHKNNGDIIENKVIISPRDSKSINIKRKDLKKYVLFINKNKKELEGKNIHKYILLGEEKGFHFRPTCSGRKRWYELEIRKPGKVLWQMIHYTRHITFLNSENVYVDHNLFELIDTNDPELYCALLNSTLYALIKEIIGRTNLGQGSLKTEGIDIKIIPIIPTDKINVEEKEKLLKIFQSMKDRPIGTIFEEIGAIDPSDVKLENIKKDRLQLDKIIFGILDLTEEEELEVYKSVIDLVRHRIIRAASLTKKDRRTKINIENIANNILQETSFKELKKFPDDYINKDIITLEKKLPEGNDIDIIEDLFNGPHVKVNGDKVIKCRSLEEAKYIRYALLHGLKTVKIPINHKDLIKILEEYDKLISEIKEKSEFILKEEIKDKNLRKRIQIEIHKKIFKT